MPDSPKESGEQQQPQENADQPHSAPLAAKEGDGHGVDHPEAQQQRPSGEQKPPKWARVKRGLHVFSKSEWVMVFLTFVIAFTAVVGIILVIQSSGDTQKMIAAAQQQACAAKSFASSAAKIDTGIGNAVTKLGRQATDAEIFFRADERAWVVVDHVVLLESYPPRDTFPWTFKYGIYAKNVGKTMALDVRIHVDSFFGFGELNKHGIEMTQGRTWGGWKGKDPAPDKAGPSSLAPGEPSLFPIVAGGEAPKGGWVQTEVGHIDYVDAFGAKHWKNFCFTVVDEKGTLNHCEGGGNDEDNNPEPSPEPN